MILRFDIKTVSEANQREHWAVKARRKRQQQHDFTILFKKQRPVIEIPAVITFTRYALKTLDTPPDEHVSDFALEALKAAEEVE